MCSSSTGIVADLLVRFALERKKVLPFGWAPRILVQCGVPFVEIWDVLHEMYESHVRFRIRLVFPSRVCTLLLQHLKLNTESLILNALY